MGETQLRSSGMPTRRNKHGKFWIAKRGCILAALLILANVGRVFGFVEGTPVLRDEITGRELTEGTRNLVICIHGWNPTGSANKYSDAEWDWLIYNMKQALPGNSSDPWSLLLYHWEADANTGFVDWLQVGYYWQATANAATCGANGWAHGISLGARLPPSLRKVHIIAHSAGAWCAYQTASALLANPYTVVQITLLDPYVPDEVPGLHGSYPTLSKTTMDGIANWPSGFSTRFSLLENYFADDSISGTIPNFPVNIIPAGVTFGTQTIFSWRPQDINLQVDWSFTAYPYRTGLADLYYDWHSGPILFYGDTIEAANGGTIEHGLPSAGLPFDYNLNGWKRSLFYRSQNYLVTRFTTQPQRTTTVASGSSVTLTVGATSLIPFTFQWFKRGQDAPIPGATFNYYTFTASSATAGDYVVRLSDTGGNLIFSDFATVNLTTPTSPPTSHTISPSSGPNGIISPSSLFSRSVGSSVTLNATPNSGYEVAYWYVNGLQMQTGGTSYTIPNLQADTVVQVTFRSTVTTSITGDLLLNVSPQSAVDAGAQWRFVSPLVGNYLTPNVALQHLGPGQYQINFKTLPNFTTPPNATVNVVAGQTAVVNGNYTFTGVCNYSLSSAGDTWPAAGGSGSFNVIAQAGCSWTASENLDWVSITSGSSGNGTHTVSFQVDYNASLSPRSGVITAAGQSFTINQNGNNGACTFSLSAPGANIPAEGGTNSFSVTTGPICFWAISRNANWITLLSPQDHTGSDSVQYTVQPYFGSLPRSALILLSTDGGQTFVSTFTVTQAGTPPPPGTLATGLVQPTSIAVDDNYVYWTESSQLKRILKSGGGETALATSVGIGHMVLDGGYLYYTDSGTKLQKLTKSGGSPTTLANGSSFYDAITVQDGTVFWGASGVIYSVPIGGGTSIGVATSSHDIASIRVTNNTIFWSQITYPSAVYTQPIGGSRMTLSSGSSVAPGLEVQNDYVYFAGYDSIYRVPMSGVSRQTLVANLNNANDLVLDATNIYWVESGDYNGTNGSVRQMPLDGGPIITLATNLAQPTAITMDSSNVYWLEFNNGGTTRSALKWAAKASTTSDTIPPSVSIANPSDGAQLNESMISVSGTAADDTSVAFIELRLNAGVWQTATGTTNWTGSVSLVSGTNTIEARSRDIAGNYSVIASVIAVYSSPDTKLPQTIVFGPLNNQVVGDAPFPLSATASSGLPVSLSVLSGPVILSSNLVTITGAGLAVLRASQSGDVTYAPAPNADQVLIISPGNNLVTDFQRLANGMFTLKFYGEPETDYVVFTSTNLVKWMPIITNQINGLGYLDFTDTSSTNDSVRFYKIGQ
jgi:Bacterial Ig domain/Divergent InlB B-repeat domain/Putative binding domain, N-terminal